MLTSQPTAKFQYGKEEIRIPKPHVSAIKGSCEWPDGWIPLTPETYRKLVGWRSSRSRLLGKLNYTPKLETMLRFGVRECPAKLGHPLIGFPYKIHGIIENIKVLELTVKTDGDVCEAIQARNEKTGVLEPVRKLWQDKSTPLNPGVLFGFDLLLPHGDGPVEDEFITLNKQLDDGRAATLFPNIFIVEGEWDAMCLVEQGYAAVSVINASASNIEPEILMVLSCADKIHLMLDSDKSGRQCAARLLPLLPEQTVVVNVPEHIKDACSLYAMYGKEGFKKAIQNLVDDKPIMGSASVATKELAWPAPMREEAFHGIAGRFARLMEPETEADPIALLSNFLVVAGVLFGRDAWAVADGTPHYPVEFVAMVGPSSSGRKGTATGRVLPLFDRVYDGFQKNRVLTGLSTAEGLIKGVSLQDGVSAETVRPYLALLREFSSLLGVMKREGNTLSAILREIWDTGRLRVLTRKDPLDVDNVNISLLAHITPTELLNKLTETDRVNGFANRFLMLCVRRNKELPEGGKEVDLGDIADGLRKAMDAARGKGALQRNAEARELWAQEYSRLTSYGDDLKGSLCSRGAAHVLRLSLLYALLDCADEVRVEHLQAALAFWEYCERSVAYLFAGQSGDPDSDKILAVLAKGPATYSDLDRIFGGNKSKDWILAKMASLEREKRVARVKVQGARKRVDGWAAT